MSGIVGTFRRDGALVERPLVAALTNFLSFRGPDAQHVWIDGCVGFGHTMLRTTREAAHERQPESLGSDFWITADVRLDCRTELIDILAQAGRRFNASEITDPELILHSYAIWREACVHHLRGDFAFALWDARERKLLCARDHFGIKPFFYSVNERQFLFSNTLNCLRAHPEISDELNEAAIGDFLLFGLNCDIATTTFCDIQRLPPAHFLVVTQDGFRVQRYWSPPIDGRIRYNRPEEYVEHFREILKASVADRLRTDRVGIFLSGGLDSGAVAATARELSSRAGGITDLQAFTIIFESPVTREEQVHAKATADHLQIPIEFLTANTRMLFREDDSKNWPEPVDNPFLEDVVTMFRQLAAYGRVALSGEGADNLMDFQMWPHAKDLGRDGKWQILTSQVLQFLWARPFPWRGIAARSRRVFGMAEARTVVPTWINAEFSRRLRLTERCKAIHFAGPMSHPLLPRAHASMRLPHWNYLFENADAGATCSNADIRYPFLDLRMVNYVLALPPFPWLFEKTLVRRSMKTALPENTLKRKKTPLSIHPVAEALKHRTANREDAEGFDVCDTIMGYVDVTRLLPLPAALNAEEAYVIVRALCLNFWLQRYKRVRYNLEVEVRHA